MATVCPFVVPETGPVAIACASVKAWAIVASSSAAVWANSGSAIQREKEREIGLLKDCGFWLTVTFTAKIPSRSVDVTSTE